MNNVRFCSVCQTTQELTTCERCMGVMQTEMISRLLEEKPELEVLRRDIRHILDEIREIKECLNSLPIKGIKLKPIPKDIEVLF